jgi:hypothetical protein
MGINPHNGARAMNNWSSGRSAVIVGFASGIALTAWCMFELPWFRTAADLEVGAHLFRTDPNEVRSFFYATDSMIFTAQRSKSGTPFITQVTYADERPFQRCIATPDLAGALTPLSLATVASKADQHDAKITRVRMLGLLELKDAVIGEPTIPWVLFIAEGESGVFIRQDDALFKTNISLATIAKIEAGCKELESR